MKFEHNKPILFPAGNQCIVQFFNNAPAGYDVRLTIGNLQPFSAINTETNDGKRVARFLIPSSLSSSAVKNFCYKYSLTFLHGTQIISPLISNWYFINNPDQGTLSLPSEGDMEYKIDIDVPHIAISEGSGGTSNYNDLTDKPSINGNELVGNKTAAELGLADEKAVEGKANKVPVAGQWKYAIASIDEVPVSDGDIFQIETGNEEVPLLELTVTVVDGTDKQWFVSPESGTAYLNLPNVTATNVSGTGSLTVSIVSETLYKDLADVEQELQNAVLAEIQSRTNADNLLGQRFSSYRTSTAQDAIDSDIKNQKLDKSANINEQQNPDGWYLNWAQITGNAVGVQIVANGYSPKLNRFQMTNLSIQVASSEVAGIVLPEVIRQVQKNAQDILDIQQTGSVEFDFQTRADLAAYDTDSNPRNIGVGASVVVIADEGATLAGSTTKWRFDPSDTTSPVRVNGFVFRFIAQEVPYGVATATVLGLILSTATNTPGKGYVEEDGTLSVWGWDAITNDIADLRSFEGLQYQYNQNHNHSGGANGKKISYDDLTDTPLKIIPYNTNAEAQADTSVNYASAPVNEGS